MTASSRQEKLATRSARRGSIPMQILPELKQEFMLIENRIKRRIEYEKTDREDKDESRFREELRDQVFPIKG